MGSLQGHRIFTAGIIHSAQMKEMRIWMTQMFYWERILNVF